MISRLVLVGLLSSVVGCTSITEGDMASDEQEIRSLFDNWIVATTEGNLELALDSTADDAVFLVPGAGEMDKMTFAQAAAGESPEESPMNFELDSQIREIKVMGDHAYLWSESRLVMTPKAGGDSTTMAGHSLSVLQKLDGRWQIIRDANTITVVPE